MKKTVETTKRGKQQEARPLAGISGEIYIATLNWPSLGITPDKPEYGLRTAAGPMAFSRDREPLARNPVATHRKINVDIPPRRS